MVASTAAYVEFLARFIIWAEARPDILLAFLVGSQARAVYPADEWADLDIVVFTTDPALYTETGEWLAALGMVWTAYLGYIGNGEPEWLVVFEGGLDVDIALATASEPFTLQQVWDTFSADLFRRGIRGLVDREGVLERLPPLPSRAVVLPDEGRFLNVLHGFWRYAARTAKKLRRGELWMAKSLCDGLLKGFLLTLIEWHAQATHGPDYDTWYEGHFLEKWADPRVLVGLRGAYAHYDVQDTWRALFATMDLFRWLAQETADLLGYAYPAEADARITAWVTACFETR